jgi:hypothetical protein
MMNHLEFEGKKAAVVIPARGGSKGLKRKNIKNLCGKPLIAYTIEAALESVLASRVIVSTEDAEIAEIAVAYGAEVPFMRPDDLAGDRSPIMEAVKYTLDKLQSDEGRLLDAYAVLYPSHPFRPSGLVDEMLAKVFDEHSQAVTVKLVNNGSFDYIRSDEDGIGLGYLECDPTVPLYRPYGLCECRSMTTKAVPRYLRIVDDDVHLTDIDTIDDFLLAERVIQNGLYKQNGLSKQNGPANSNGLYKQNGLSKQNFHYKQNGPANQNGPAKGPGVRSEGTSPHLRPASAGPASKA